MANNNNQSRRGFASMDEDKQREIASKGGKAAHEKGTAHEFDSEEAKEAGRRGGQARQSQSGNSAENSEEASGSDLLDDFDR
jgi:general stress protein YciG